MSQAALSAFPEPAPAPAVETVGLSCWYVPGRPVLRDIDLAVAPGSICMILGPSGSGKSTLLKVIKGLLPLNAGTLSLFGQPVAGRTHARSRRALERSVAWIPQHLGLVRSLTVLDNVLSGTLARVGTLASLVGAFPHTLRDEALATLDSLGIRAKADEKVFSLSGGERQRVAIARALMQHPTLVLADEFVSQLDPLTTREMLDIVQGIARTGVAFLITSHEVELVAEYGDRVVFIRDGRKIHEGAANAFTFASVMTLMGR
ncbi:MAG: ATP-binding cassette domain-containing protein [Acidobacteria bacterium]|nr:ATP-binding cassette domain-containing protein [Acidobacteriota bacterium]